MESIFKVDFVPKWILRSLSQLTRFSYLSWRRFCQKKLVTLELIKASIMNISLQKYHVLEILGRVQTEWSAHIFSEEIQYFRWVDN